MTYTDQGKRKSRDFATQLSVLRHVTEGRALDVDSQLETAESEAEGKS